MRAEKSKFDSDSLSIDQVELLVKQNHQSKFNFRVYQVKGEGLDLSKSHYSLRKMRTDDELKMFQIGGERHPNMAVKSLAENFELKIWINQNIGSVSLTQNPIKIDLKKLPHLFSQEPHK